MLVGRNWWGRAVGATHGCMEGIFIRVDWLVGAWHYEGVEHGVISSMVHNKWGWWSTMGLRITVRISTIWHPRGGRMQS